MHPTLVDLSLDVPALSLLLLGAGTATAFAMAAVFAFVGGARRLGGVLAVGGLSALGLGLFLRDRKIALGTLPLHSFGVLLFVAVVLAALLFLRALDRAGVDRPAAERATVIIVVAGLVAARAGYVLINPGSGGPSELLAVGHGGLSAPAGALGASLAFLGVSRRLGVPGRRLADFAISPCGCLVLVGAIASYLSGGDFGRPLSDTAPHVLATLGTFPRWDLPLGVDGPPALLAQMELGRIGPEATATAPVHPTPLYEASLGLVLLWLSGSLPARQRVHGEACLWAVAAYGTLKFLVEGLRGDADRGLLPVALPPLPLLLGGAALLLSLAFVGMRRDPGLRRRPLPAAFVAGVVLTFAALVGWLSPGELRPSYFQVLALGCAAAALVVLPRLRRSAT